MFVIWSDDLATGIEQIDNDHKDMFRLVNDLHEAVASGREPLHIAQVLTRLADYASGHFRREEWAMQRWDYPGFEEHVALHSQFLDRLAILVHEHELGSLTVSQNTLDFLKGWVVEHIAGQDRALSEFLRKRLGASFGGTVGRALPTVRPGADAPQAKPAEADA